MKNYPGAKNNSGILQFLINNIPFHIDYYELFAGSAALFANKKTPTGYSILNDKNRDVSSYLKSLYGKQKRIITESVDAKIVLGRCDYDYKTFMYLDPPYPFSSRRNNRVYYKCEMTDEDHVQLLTAALECKANIMISTRKNEIYDSMLKDWRLKEFNTVDRAGKCTEQIFMNYEEPEILHQYDYLGNDRTHRQQMRRKAARFADKIRALPVHEQHLFIMELIKSNYTAVKHFADLPQAKIATPDRSGPSSQK